jgi:adenylate cyclase
VAIISARHCELEFRDGSWFVRDLNSSNGTRVNGRPCVPIMQRLMHNDELWIAAFRFKVAYPSSVPLPEQSPAQSADGPAAVKPPLGAMASVSRTPSSQVGSRSSLGDLVPCGGGRPIPLIKSRIVLGRHPKCDIVLSHNTISARHCQLDLIKGCWNVRDLSSRNGIRVNGMKCEEGALPPESILSVATLRYHVVYEGPPELAGPSAESIFSKSLMERAGIQDDTDPEQHRLG